MRGYVKIRILTCICLSYKSRIKHVTRSTCDRCLDCEPARQTTCLLPLVLPWRSVRHSPLINIPRVVSNSSVDVEACVSFPVIKSETCGSPLYAAMCQCMPLCASKCRSMLPTISVASRIVSSKHSTTCLPATERRRGVPIRIPNTSRNHEPVLQQLHKLKQPESVEPTALARVANDVSANETCVELSQRPYQILTLPSFREHVV